MEDTRLPKHASTTNPEEKEMAESDGNASMPEQVRRPNPWKKKKMMMMS
jgi:hypothetical protein